LESAAEALDINVKARTIVRTGRKVFIFSLG
jgi:hypothetical protein